MTVLEFGDQMNRLKAVFGEKAYPREREILIWNDVRFLSISIFARVVDRLIGEFRHAPLLPDFRDVIVQEREKNRDSESDRPNWDTPFAYTCDFCKDLGVYLCKHPTKGGMWAFRCHCEKGERDPRKKIPQYKQAHRDEGFYWVEMNGSVDQPKGDQIEAKVQH